LDSDQKKAVSRLLAERVAIIDGPEGSGKSFTASIAAALCIKSGEKVCFLARTTTSLQKLFIKVTEVCKELEIPFSTIEQFRMSSAAQLLPAER